MDDVPRPGVLYQLNSDSDSDNDGDGGGGDFRPPLYQVARCHIPSLSDTRKYQRGREL